MTTKLAKNTTPEARRFIGPKMEEALAPGGSMDPPTSEADQAGRGPALALHMGLPGTRLDLVLGGPHPLLVHLVRAMARAAAQADHTAELAQTTDAPACRTKD